MASSPRILNRPTQPTDQTPNRINAKSPVQFIVAPRAQVSRRGETQAPLGGKPAKLCYRFGPLTPSARSANLIAGNGTKNGFPAPNKEPAINQNHHLTGKAPYRFESGSLPSGESAANLSFRRPNATRPYLETAALPIAHR